MLSDKIEEFLESVEWYRWNFRNIYNPHEDVIERIVRDLEELLKALVDQKPPPPDN